MTTDSRISLALCITELNVGGAERCLTELASRLDRSRFAPVVYSLGPRPPVEQAALVARLEQAGVPVHFLNGRSMLAAPLVLWWLVCLLRTQRPQIVQTFLFHANVVGVVAARLAGVRTVVTGIRVAERGKPWHLHWARRVDRWVTRHVCVSLGVQEFSATAGGLLAEKLIVIPNGVDLERFHPALPCPPQASSLKPQAYSGRRLILFVGRLDKQKGLAGLIELSPHLFAALPEHDLVLVGEGPQRAQLESLSRRVGTSGRIHFAGWRADVPEILAAADLLVLPALWEGMPNVLLEAMAAGKPFVATATEGVAELAGPLADGQVVARDDSQALCDAIVAIASQPAIQAALGRENRTRVEQKFGIDAMIDRYARLYVALLADQNSGR